MSIDARVKDVLIKTDQSGDGYLILEARPPSREGETPGIPGQNTLRFHDAPPWVSELAGKDIWGGCSSIMFGEQEIAERKGYTSIVFTAKSLHGFGPSEAKRRGLE